LLASQASFMVSVFKSGLGSNGLFPLDNRWTAESKTKRKEEKQITCGIHQSWQLWWYRRNVSLCAPDSVFPPGWSPWFFRNG
jgi:hypothetical protein